MPGIMEHEMPLGPKGTLHRDQDMIDYWIVDELSKKKIAENVGLSVHEVNRRFDRYRAIGVKIPAKKFGGGKGGQWVDGKPERIVLTPEDVEKYEDSN